MECVKSNRNGTTIKLNSIDTVNKIVRLSNTLGRQVPDMYDWGWTELTMYVEWLEREIKDKG